MQKFCYKFIEYNNQMLNSILRLINFLKDRTQLFAETNRDLFLV